ncbi:MAG TPA: alpha/beta fold hydrolase [Usitatibacter sp.]|nr:alpha/beta fold hydrolase [Usitatibacter sp.]
MSPRATEVIFLPGFDGDADLRAQFVAELSRHHRARAIGYPNRPLGTLNGYARHASSQAAPGSRPVLVAESFSGLVAARWAANDPHVAGLVLCGAFARNPVAWASMGASLPGLTRFLGSCVMAPAGLASTDAARRRWSMALSRTLSALPREVLAERLRLIASEDVGAELSRIGVPIVLLQFDEDLVVGRPAREHLESACAGAKVIRFPGPHFAIETRPAESARAIAEPLAGLFAQAA